jgi:hypothetical protein
VQIEVGLKFHVRWPTGRVEVLLVDAPSALIGTAAHCEVRLPTEGGAHEHVEVLATNGAVHLSTRSESAPALLDGHPFVAGPWPPGSVLTIGETQMSVETVDLRPNVKRRSPFLALLPIPPVVVAALVFAQSGAAAEAQIPAAPALFDAPIASCPNPPSPTLAAYAAERARIGYAKRERNPFSRPDGIEAVSLLETAAVCYRVAGRQDEARETSAAAQGLRTKLEEDYRVRRVRLEHAINVKDPIAAKRELNVLIPMTAHRRGAYIDWLASTDRFATAAAEQRTSRRL